MAKNDVLSTVSTRPRASVATPQRRPAVADQVRNAAGGYVFGITDEAKLHRFLTMGTDGGTYYTSERELTKANAEVVLRAAASAPLTLVRAIVEVSTAGRAPKANPAIFALAIAASHADEAGRKAALAALPQVCRTGTHLFLFLKYVGQFRGWGRGLRKAVGSWYDDKPIDKLAYQVEKYRQREGWTHKDALRMAHTFGDAEHNTLYNYLAGRGVTNREGVYMTAKLPELVLAYEALQIATTKTQVVNLVGVDGVSWEMIPDQWINEADVWAALLGKGLPQTALIRQLPRLTRLGLGVGTTGAAIVAQLGDAEKLKKGRVHPLSMLVAQKTYASGKSERGNSTWVPVPQIADALDAGFYASVPGVEPAGKRTLVGIDCSGSMGGGGWGGGGYGSRVSGLPLTCVEACAVVAMVTAATEPASSFIGFDTSAWDLPGLSPRRRLDDNVKYLQSNIRGGTDVAQPIHFALKNRLIADTIIILTDGETWAGRRHPFEVMTEYRRKINPAAKLAVVAMTSTGTSVVAPFDEQALDVSGFDSAVPGLLADFSAGRV
jgi:60 kDa SS-A/Ro ribonucleoprotein